MANFQLSIVAERKKLDFRRCPRFGGLPWRALCNTGKRAPGWRLNKIKKTAQPEAFAP